MALATYSQIMKGDGMAVDGGKTCEQSLREGRTMAEGILTILATTGSRCMVDICCSVAVAWRDAERPLKKLCARWSCAMQM